MTNSKTPGVLGRTLEGPFFVAVALTVSFYVFVHQEGMRGTALHRYTTAHVTEYIVVSLFFWGVAGLAFHCLGFRREAKALRHAWLPASDGHEPVDSARALLARVETQPGWLRKTKMGGRLQAALTYVCQKRSADGFEDHLRDLSDRDAEQTHANYALQRLIVCIAPLLGLIGTVVHFGTALGGISFDEIQKKLPEVVSAMGTAFDTTTVALGVAMVTMFLLFVAQRAEEGIGYQVDALVQRELAHRFTAQDARLTPFLGTLESAAQSTLATIQQVVSQQLQAWFQVSQHCQQQDQQHQQRQIEQWSAALARQEERHEALDAQREARLEQFFAALESQHAEHLTQLAAATDHVGGLQQNLGQVAETLSEVMTGESRLLVLQDRLAENLRLLEQTGDLHQAVHGLTAAIHLLTARHDPSTTRNKAA